MLASSWEQNIFNLNFFPRQLKTEINEDKTSVKIFSIENLCAKIKASIVQMNLYE